MVRESRFFDFAKKRTPDEEERDRGSDDTDRLKPAQNREGPEGGGVRAVLSATAGHIRQRAQESPNTQTVQNTQDVSNRPDAIPDTQGKRLQELRDKISPLKNLVDARPPERHELEILREAAAMITQFAKHKKWNGVAERVKNIDLTKKILFTKGYRDETGRVVPLRQAHSAFDGMVTLPDRYGSRLKLLQGAVHELWHEISATNVGLTYEGADEYVTMRSGISTNKIRIVNNADTTHALRFKALNEAITEELTLQTLLFADPKGWIVGGYKAYRAGLYAILKRVAKHSDFQHTGVSGAWEVAVQAYTEGNPKFFNYIENEYGGNAEGHFAAFGNDRAFDMRTTARLVSEASESENTGRLEAGLAELDEKPSPDPETVQMFLAAERAFRAATRN